MKAINATATKGLTKKSWCICADNSGAKICEIISVFGFKGKKRQQPQAGIADLVNVVVKKGKPEIRKKVERAVIVRTRDFIRRPDGGGVRFDDNACVIIANDGQPKGTRVFGPVARELKIGGYKKILSLAPDVL